MRYGKNLSALQAMHDAGKVVPAIRDRPGITGYEWLWQAFHDLNTCRSYGMAPGPIPWTSIQHYAEANGMGVADTWMLHRVIRAADNVWLEFKAEAAALASKQAAKPSRPARGRR